ncbi:Arm DNA-binding domain-containing protein [Flavivirga rizhaonensis]|uniref:Arm DNA-binding domain-containing protein n=1 Tax=Flavivirga rizhaonensis TaxID=2559571 RepID=UPI002938FBD9|nr:Arm DNA-binding domain-containing protein [Flavivirga rizhaonensis]
MTVNGKRAELSLKRKLSISDWDSNKSKLKGLSDETKIVNNYIKQVNSQLFECYQKLKTENKAVTSTIIKSYFLGEGESQCALTDIIEYHNEHMKSTLRWETQKNYFTTHIVYISFSKAKT